VGYILSPLRGWSSGIFGDIFRAKFLANGQRPATNDRPDD
jgi:hypothetical protein